MEETTEETIERKHPEAICEDCTLIYMRHANTWIPKIRQYNILFVGEAAGEVEAYTNIPFTGPAGKTHWSICKAVGIKKDLIAHTNICLCWPRQDGKPNFRRPMLKEILCCFPRLKWEIQQIKPKLIVALGDVAMNGLTAAQGKITSNVGRVVNLRDDYEFKCDVLIAYHPSYVMRNRTFIPAQAGFYKQALDHLKGVKRKDFNPKLILDPDERELHEYLYASTGPYGCDTETTGLNTRKDTILGFSFAKDATSAASIMFKGPTDPRWRTIQAFLADPGRRKIWQNGSFDTSMLRYSENSPIPLIDNGFYFDTRLAQQLLKSDMPSDLDYLRGEYTTIPPYKPSKKKIANIQYWGKEEALKYAALDAVTTRAVHDEQLKELSKQELTLMEELLIPLVYAIGRMENRGVLVDKECLVTLYAAIVPELERIEKELEPYGFNVQSPTSIREKFGLKTTNREQLKYHITRRDKNWEIYELILEHRTLAKQASTYLLGVYKRLENGRIHTKFKIEGTGTGRLSSQDPNLQNVINEMRQIYIPDPNHIFLRGDHSQIELWVGAIIVARLTGDNTMLYELMDGKDIHYIACQLCFPDVPLLTGTRKGDFKKWEVLAAKTVTFGTFYGRGARSIAVQFGVSVNEAETWKLRLFNRYPGLKNYSEIVQDEVKTKGYLTTPFGRKRYIESINQGVNFPIQSTASDITVGSVVEADKIGLKPVITVHDDIIFQVPIKTFKSDFAKIRKVMERPVKQLDNHQFKIDYAKGVNWYELEDIPIP